MEIVERDALAVVGLPVRAAWGDLWAEMPIAWHQFIDRHTEIDHGIGETFIDVSLEKNGDEYVQLIGSQVSQVDRIPPDMRAVAIPAQPYIYHKHVGPTEGIAESLGAMYDWAQQQDQPAGDIKLDIGYTADGHEREHDLFIGLLPEKKWRVLPDERGSSL